jgi:threonine dehydrogenase-like Zn-dependent dehydrogenase
MGDTMKAVNYQGAFKVKVEDVPMPKIEHPDDIIVKVTTAAICGSDLHMVRTAFCRKTLSHTYTHNHVPASPRPALPQASPLLPCSP